MSGERLVFGSPPSVELIGAAFNDVPGVGDDHDALNLCQEWCKSIDDVLWYFEAVGVVGSKRSQKLLGDVLGDAPDDEALTMLSLYAVRDALDGLRSRMVARMSAAHDGWYLKEQAIGRFAAELLISPFGRSRRGSPGTRF